MKTCYVVVDSIHGMTIVSRNGLRTNDEVLYSASSWEEALEWMERREKRDFNRKLVRRVLVAAVCVAAFFVVAY